MSREPHSGLMVFVLVLEFAAGAMIVWGCWEFLGRIFPR
jgi:hypothetical protein